MRRFLSPRWLLRHAVVIVLVAAFLSLAWWQVSRARSGNTLSIAYAAEWPLFALFVVALWVREIRAELRPATEAPARDRSPDRPRPVAVPVTGHGGQPDPDDEDPALVAYNDYLAWLAANPDRRPAQYRPTVPYRPTPQGE